MVTIGLNSFLVAFSTDRVIKVLSLPNLKIVAKHFIAFPKICLVQIFGASFWLLCIMFFHFHILCNTTQAYIYIWTFPDAEHIRKHIITLKHGENILGASFIGVPASFSCTCSEYLFYVVSTSKILSWRDRCHRYSQPTKSCIF